MNLRGWHGVQTQVSILSVDQTSAATIAITKHKMTLHIWPVRAELSLLTCIGHVIYWNILSFIADGLLVEAMSERVEVLVMMFV